MSNRHERMTHRREQAAPRQRVESVGRYTNRYRGVVPWERYPASPLWRRWLKYIWDGVKL
jgi:hypothetical protein